MKSIKYIGFYDLPAANGSRVSALAAINKMDYIADAITQAGFQVHIVSPSWSSGNGSNITVPQGGTIQINPSKKVTFSPTFSTTSKLTEYFKIFYSLFWLFFWLINNTKRNETIILYHVQWLSIPIRWAKKIIGFKLILEVEEIYGDVSTIHTYFDDMERKLLAAADKYIFSTELLAEKITKNKPNIIIYGEYRIYPKLESPPADGKIHLLYAGIIDTHKAGAFNALGAAKFLSNKYVIHIIGFGDVNLLKSKIAEANQLNNCKVYYHGALSGEEYIRFCQKCHVGLSTQKMDGDYLNSSFPSKILSYMSLGLTVISGNIQCVKMSKIGKLVNYYRSNDPAEIADAIKGVDICNLESSSLKIKELNNNFVIDIRKMLKS